MSFVFKLLDQDQQQGNNFQHFGQQSSLQSLQSLQQSHKQSPLVNLPAQAQRFDKI
jgi:hypothetical protein